MNPGHLRGVWAGLDIVTNALGFGFHRGVGTGMNIAFLAAGVPAELLYAIDHDLWTL